MKIGNSKALLKDLPFGDVLADTVITHQNHGYCIEKEDGRTLIFSDAENDIMTLIWDNDRWMKDVVVSPTEWNITPKSITISFNDPLNIKDIEQIKSGIQRVLSEQYTTTTTAMGWTELTKIDWRY